jgi:hypothetical protein
MEPTKNKKKSNDTIWNFFIIPNPSYIFFILAILPLQALTGDTVLHRVLIYGCTFLTKRGHWTMVSFDPATFRFVTQCLNHCATACPIRKCSAKNCVSVALSTANPPHTHWTISFPTYEIADNKFVMTHTSITQYSV